MASITANSGARMERHPLMAQAHGIRDGSLLPSLFNPVGKGTPMSSAGGNRKKKTDGILRDMENGEMRSEKNGRTRL
jgi:hypothetical protein